LVKIDLNWLKVVKYSHNFPLGVFFSFYGDIHKSSLAHNPRPGVNEPEIMYFIRCIFDWHQRRESEVPWMFQTIFFLWQKPKGLPKRFRRVKCNQIHKRIVIEIKDSEVERRKTFERQKRTYEIWILKTLPERFTFINRSFERFIRILTLNCELHAAGCLVHLKKIINFIFNRLTQRKAWATTR
jgi:hypothetical protein